jgi:hypothetical protein
MKIGGTKKQDYDITREQHLRSSEQRDKDSYQRYTREEKARQNRGGKDFNKVLLTYLLRP